MITFKNGDAMISQEDHDYLIDAFKKVLGQNPSVVFWAKMLKALAKEGENIGLQKGWVQKRPKKNTIDKGENNAETTERTL
jgi:hypothetical protein